MAVIILSFIMLSLQSRSIEIVPTHLPPTDTPEPTPVSDSELENAVLKALFPYLKEPALHTERESSWLLETAVSSGIYTSTQFLLDSRVEVTLDLLQAYFLLRPGKVLEVPVVIGLQVPGKPYTYFSDLYFYQNLYQNPAPNYPTRAEALADARLRLPRGRVFLLIAEAGVSADSLDWEVCQTYMHEFRHYPIETCPLGEALDQAHPGTLAAFIQKSASAFPKNWCLASWFFQELDPLSNPNIQTDIPLPPMP